MESTEVGEMSRKILDDTNYNAVMEGFISSIQNPRNDSRVAAILSEEPNTSKISTADTTELFRIGISGIDFDRLMRDEKAAGASRDSENFARTMDSKELVEMLTEALNTNKLTTAEIKDLIDSIQNSGINFDQQMREKRAAAEEPRSLDVLSFIMGFACAYFVYGVASSFMKK